jgi:hypothetical protein
MNWIRYGDSIVLKDGRHVVARRGGRRGALVRGGDIVRIRQVAAVVRDREVIYEI